MKVAAKERRLAVKYIRQATYGDEWIGPYSGYTGYSLPQGGRIGKWSVKRRPHLCHSGWHGYVNAKRMMKYPPTSLRRWFLVELEGPFREDHNNSRHAKIAATRCRFIREITQAEWAGGMRTMRKIAKAAKDEGLL